MTRKRLWIGLLFLGAFAAGLAGAEQENQGPVTWSFTGELNLAPSLIDEQPRVYDRLITALLFDYEFIHLIMEMSLVNDQKYSPMESYWLGRYFYPNNGGLELDFGPLSLRAGKLVHRDFLDTPYSLFISSQDLPALLAEISFHGGPFSYESRWIRLNTRSQAYPDRGANYKVFAGQIGEVRFGLQDIAVYVDRVFDEEYFFSPMPHIVTQMVTKGPGKPWSEEANDNSIMGLFADWRRPKHYVYAQWLVDDVNADFLIDWLGLRDTFGDRKIPWKTAWSVGGFYEFPFGRLGFYHAGATKYTFEATQAGIPYGYTYYPAVEYLLRDGTPMTLYPVDNYIGYLYGENNLAFLVDYHRQIRSLGIEASLEYVVSGSKSPANPWHQFTGVTEAGRETRLLDDPVLEHTIVSGFAATWRWRWLTLYSRLRLGGVFNRLGPEAPNPDDTEGDILRPQPGENRFIYAWSVGATYTWNGG
jgi:hypothetical protein